MTPDYQMGTPDTTVTRADRKKAARKTFTEWVCPSCGRRYTSPLPVLTVACGSQRSHKTGKAVAMRPA